MGLSPQTFWNMTLVEWRAALAGYLERNGMTPRAPGLTRSTLTNLMNRYPD